MENKFRAKLTALILLALFIWGCTEEETTEPHSVPSTPTLSSPSNGTTNISLPPSLVWNASNGATSYTLQVSININFTTFMYNQSGLTSTSQQIAGLDSNTIYYWRVSATNSYGTSEYSIIWNFTTEPINENLLINTSFEKNGRFSSDGWSLPAQSDSSADVPSGGGSYSLELEASQPPESYAQITVPVNTQFSNYKLTFWSKYSVIEGKGILSLVRNGSAIKSLSISVDDIIWQSYSIQDTFSVASGDSFMVQLTAGISQLLPGKTYFDLCQLQGIN